MAKKKPAVPTDAADEPFEDSLAALEGVVADLEGGDLPLADALSRYEEGVRRLKACHAQLEHAERRIELLSGLDADGNPVTQPFDDSPTESGLPRSAHRGGAKKPPAEGLDVDDRPRLF